MVDLKRLLRAGLALAIVGAAGGAAPASAPPPAWLVPAMRARVAGNPGVAIVAAYVDGDASGIVSINADESTAYDAETVFEVGSVTKLFTTTLFAEMIDEGVVTADEPIDALLPPEVHAPHFEGKPITLVDLATQTSGLARLPSNLVPRDITNPYADYTNARLFDAVNEYVLARAPGSTYEYSNFGIAVLGQLLARKLGEPYDAAIQTRILTPLGMAHSSLIASTFASSTAVPHDVDGLPTKGWDDLAFAPAGALRSSATDMLKFLRVNLSSATDPLTRAARLAQTPVRPTATDGQRIGYGWTIDGTPPITWHNGATGGYWAFIGIDRASRRGIVVLTNMQQSVDDIGFHYLDASRPLKPEAPDVVLTAAEQAVIAGSYQDATSGVVVRIHVEGGRLIVTVPGFGDHVLHATSTRSFGLRGAQADFEFTLPSSGPATRLDLTFGGRTLTLLRTSG